MLIPCLGQRRTNVKQKILEEICLSEGFLIFSSYLGEMTRKKRVSIDPGSQSILSELRERLKEIYGPRLVRLVLFGSQARGDAAAGSDLDVLVVLQGPVDAGLEINRTGGVVAELSLAHDAVIACVFMDEERFLHRQGPFLRNVRREGITL